MGATAATIQAGPGGGGGGLAASVPGGTRTLVIGGAALAAVVLAYLVNARGTSSAASDGQAAQGGRLDSSANIALGQVAYEQRKAAGEQSQRDALMANQLASVQLATQQLTALGFNIREYQDASASQLDTYAQQLLALGFNIREYQDAYAGMGAAPAFSLDSGQAGGQLGLADVDNEPEYQAA